jgi:hypothetical protein
MADVLFVCVREDLAIAEVLAGVMDEAGFSIDASAVSEASIANNHSVIALISQAALAEPNFRRAVEYATHAEKAVIASLMGATSFASFDLSDWDGEDEAPLGGLLAAVARAVKLGRSAADRREPGQVIDLSERIYAADLPPAHQGEGPSGRPHWDAAWQASLPSAYLAQRQAR